MALPCPAVSCPGLLCLATRSICGIETAPISVRLALRGETPPAATARGVCFLPSLCVCAWWAVDLPFSPGSGVLDPLRSRTLLAHQAPTRPPTPLIQLPPAHQSVNQASQPTIANRSRHLSDVSSSSEHAGLFWSTPRQLHPPPFPPFPPGMWPTCCCSSSSRAI